MFDKLRQSLDDLLRGATSPADRREILADMKATLVQARMGLDDLRQLAESTRGRLEVERLELETVRRRKALAAKIDDKETVSIAERYERQHDERAAVLAKKLEAQEAELALGEQEVAQMTADLKRAAAGVGSVPSSGGPLAGADPLDEHERLQQELDALGRARRRGAQESSAEEQLAALKRRMGK